MLYLSLLFLLIISFISFLAQNVLFKFAMDYFDKAASGLAELGELVEGDLSGLEVVEGEVGCCFILFCFCRTLSSLFSRFNIKIVFKII